MAGGTSEKLERIYHLYQDAMLRLARRILGQAQDAEDAVQSAFVSIAAHLDHLSAPEDPRTRGYVMVITERKSIDLLRERRRRSYVPLEEEEPRVEFPAREGHDLAWCLTQLPPRYREILLLRYVYGYSLRECGTLMDLSYDSVGKLAQRAKARLEALCRQEEILF